MQEKIESMAPQTALRLTAYTAIALLVVFVLWVPRPLSALATPATPSQDRGFAPIQVGQECKVLVGAVALRFKILEIGKGGLAKVEAAEAASGVGINKGTAWWLNLNQALLVEDVKHSASAFE